MEEVEVAPPKGGEVRLKVTGQRVRDGLKNLDCCVYENSEVNVFLKATLHLWKL